MTEQLHNLCEILYKTGSYQFKKKVLFDEIDEGGKRQFLAYLERSSGGYFGKKSNPSESRQKAMEKLAEKIMRRFPEYEIINHRAGSDHQTYFYSIARSKAPSTITPGVSYLCFEVKSKEFNNKKKAMRDAENKFILEAFQRIINDDEPKDREEPKRTTLDRYDEPIIVRDSIKNKIQQWQTKELTLLKMATGIDHLEGEKLDSYLTASLMPPSFCSNDEQRDYICGLLGLDPSFSDYQTLETLGDRVLDLVAVDYMLARATHERLSPKTITLNKHQIVKNSSLAKICEEELKLNRYMLGHNSKMLTSNKVKADLVESFIGAIFKACGYDVAKEVVIGIVNSYGQKLQE